MTLSDIMGKFYEDIDFFGLMIAGKLYEVINIDINTGADPVKYRMICNHPHLGLMANLLFELKDASPEIPEKDELNPRTVYYMNYMRLIKVIQNELMLVASNPALESHSQLDDRSPVRLVLNLDAGMVYY